MQVIETTDELEPEALLPEIDEQIPDDKGIEVMFDSLPFSIQDSPLSELRSGVVHLKRNQISFDGRNTVPDYLRAKLYTLGSIFFLPGIALTYYLIEQVSFIPCAFTLSPDDIIAYTLKEDHCIISILFNPTGSDNSTARRTLTFQLPKGQFLRVKQYLADNYSEKLTEAELKPTNAAGSSNAAIGILIWILVIVGSILWHPQRF